MKYFLIILAIVGLIYTFRSEESRKSFMAKFTTQKSIINKNKERAYNVIPPLQANRAILYFNLNTNMANVNRDWWKSMTLKEREDYALLIAVYIASENKMNKLEARIFTGDDQLGTFYGYEGYKDYNAVDFDKFNK